MTQNNYHTHTLFCDGKNTPKDMILAGIAAGCNEIGFSGHSFLDFDSSWTMNPQSAAVYRENILRLRAKYEEHIRVYLGIEQDYYSKTDEVPMYDYVIGGVHCLFKDGHYVSVDESEKEQKRCIDTYYGGDTMAFAEDYFKVMEDLYEKTQCNIVAHFDLLTKFSLIDTENPRYIAAEQKALDALIKTPAIFEINTGAISRGFRTEPYPGKRVLQALADAKKSVIISSDAHNKDTLLFGFSDARRLAESYGLTVKTTLL